jgi:transcriptional regulator with XRE-family HTH domain
MPTLKQLREQAGLTQAALAKHAGCSTMRICHMEQGQAASRELIDKVLAVLGVAFEEVEGLVVSKSPEERVNRSFGRQFSWRDGNRRQKL